MPTPESRVLPPQYGQIAEPGQQHVVDGTSGDVPPRCHIVGEHAALVEDVDERVHPKRERRQCDARILSGRQRGDDDRDWGSAIASCDVATAGLPAIAVP